MSFLRKDKLNQYKIDESIFFPKEDDHIIECKKVSCIIFSILGSCSLFTVYFIYELNKDFLINNTMY